MFHGLRALLIQKDVKQLQQLSEQSESLRALLIQKDVKQQIYTIVNEAGLRALLIQKDVKLFERLPLLVPVWERC